MISFIVPIYNAEPYLSACIESLLHQTEKELQIILVDDGSTDHCPVIAQRYAEQDQRVEVYRQTHAGQSAARNTGLTHAKGEYIAFLDADDTLEPDWCTRHLSSFADVDYIQSGYRRVQAGKGLYAKLPTHPFQFTSPCMRLYRRDAIEGMRFEEGMIYEDVIWSVDLWLRGLRCRMIPYTGYRYTLNPDSTTSRPNKQAQQLLMRTLRAKTRQASFKGKIIILYTLMRLHAHFLKS